MDILRYKKRTDYVFQDEFLSSVLTWELTIEKLRKQHLFDIQVWSAW